MDTDTDSDWDDRDWDATELHTKSMQSSPSSRLTAVESKVMMERVGTADTISLKSFDSIPTPLPPQWRRNERFYMSLVTFRVGDQLFRVPRDRFQNGSEYFRKMFATNEDVRGLHEGDGDTTPMHLEGVNEEDFEDLLQLLYPQGPNLSSSQSTSKCLKVLKLAHKWRFTDIREHCIFMLDHVGLDVVSRISIAHDCEISSWYMPAYMTLAKRPRPIDIQEAEKLGFRFVVKMAQVRERRLARRLKDKDDDDADEVLKKDIRELLFIDDVPKKSTK